MPPGFRSVVTIRHVARAAGVSVATVSRVYNHSALVREETRKQVEAAGTRLGYAPHGTARSLITSKTSTLGVLLPDLYGEFFSEVIRGIDQAAQASGYHLLVSSSHDDMRALTAVLRSMRGRVDGLVVMSPDVESPVALSHLPEQFPVVFLNCPAEGADSITIANRDGARAMVSHLVDLGHRDIAMIKGPRRNYDAVERLAGYRLALRERQVRWSAQLEVAGDFSERSGYRAVRELLGRSPRPTAIFAANDSMAIGALGALREGGIAVPGAMAVAGFDDIPMASYVSPALTSVHVDISALGERAAVRLLGAIRRSPGDQPFQEVLPAALVVRESCGAAIPEVKPPWRKSV